jgi:hypothetical protein
MIPEQMGMIGSPFLMLNRPGRVGQREKPLTGGKRPIMINWSIWKD